MSVPDWELSIVKASTDKAGKPSLARTYAVDASLTDYEFNKQVQPVSAPKADNIELRAVSSRDITVCWKRIYICSVTTTQVPTWRLNGGSTQ